MGRFGRKFLRRFMSGKLDISGKKFNSLIDVCYCSERGAFKGRLFQVIVEFKPVYDVFFRRRNIIGAWDS